MDEPAPALPVHALPGAVDRVLALDGPGTVQEAAAVRAFAAGDRFEVGPFQVRTWSLPHSVPNAGLRLEAGGRVLASTGDTGPSPEVVALAQGADLFVAEASFAERAPTPSGRYLSSALVVDRTAGLERPQFPYADDMGTSGPRAAVGRR